MQTALVNILAPINRSHPHSQGLLRRWQALPGGVWGGTNRVWDLCQNTYSPGSTGTTPVFQWTGNGITKRPGDYGYGAFYSNANSRILLAAAGDSPDLDLGTGDFSFAAWFRYASPTTGGFLFARTSGASTAGFDVLLNEANAGGRLAFRIGTTGQIANVGANDNLWHRIVCVRRFGLTYMYLDGKVIASGASQASTVTNVLAQANLFARQGVVNSIAIYTDDVRIYNRGLVEAEVLADWKTSRMQYDPTLNWVRLRVPYKPSSTTAKRRRLMLLGIGK